MVRSPSLALIRLLLVLLVVACATPAITPTPPATAQSLASPFGVNSHVASRYGIHGSQHIPLDLLARHNVSWVREEFRWDMVQKSPRDAWDWGFTDELVEKATARGLNILGLLAYSVEWANRPGGGGRPVFAMPGDLNAYRAYVKKVVERYRGRVRAWEIWNEPNHDIFWQPRANAGQYALLLQVAAQTIRETDPGARVVIGGVSGSDIAFLEEVVARVGWQSFDIVAAHPYVAPRSPERGRLAEGELAKLQAFVERHGGGKPIWLTEIGWPSSTRGHWGVGDPDTQANYLVRGMVLAATSPGVERVFWYNWRNDGTDRGNDEHNYGLIEHDWRTPKPGATAFRVMSQRLEGATAGRRLDLASGNRFILNDFEGDHPWHIWGDGAFASVERSGEQRHNGAASGQVRFGFTNGGKAYVDLQNERQSPGQPRRLGLWARGDASGHLLWATFRDAHNEWFRVYLGAIGAGWQQREAALDSFEANGDGDGIIQYPIRFQSLIIDNEPDGTNGQGTIYLDDLYTEEGPEVHGARFDRAGKHVDVLWTADGATDYALPTAAASAIVTGRGGQSQTINAANGVLSLTLGEAPIFVEHVGRGEAIMGPPPPPPPPVGPLNEHVTIGTGYADDAFSRVWRETDAPVADGQASRTWYWGPAPWVSRVEPYAQSPDGGRLVQYFDKSRMEITRPGTDRASQWFISNGLLVREMVSGRVQTGDDGGQVEPRAPAEVPAAGDLSGANPAPTYASFARIASLANDNRAPDRRGQRADTGIDRAGAITATPGLAGPAVEFVQYDGRLGHNIPRVFWEFMNQQGPVFRDGRVQTGLIVEWEFAFGLPITEPYWTRVRTGGVERDVLVQLFERRVLTYTPANDGAWQVEMGNVGQHYYAWRHGATPWNR